MWTFFVFCYYPTNVELLLLAVACGPPPIFFPWGKKWPSIQQKSPRLKTKKRETSRALFFDEKILYSTHVGYIV